MAGQNPSTYDEQLPQDFVGHLEQRLGIETGEVVATLAKWVSTYQPGPLALERAGHGERASTHRH